MRTLVWIVAFRDDASSPQQELKRYTKEAADRFAIDVITNGGVALVVEDEEGDEDILDNSGEVSMLIQSNRSTLKW